MGYKQHGQLKRHIPKNALVGKGEVYMNDGFLFTCDYYVSTIWMGYKIKHTNTTLSEHFHRPIDKS